MFMASQGSWFNRRSQALRQKGACSTPRPRLPLRVEALEDRTIPATLNITGGALTYTGAAGELNKVKISVFSGTLRFVEAPGIPITLPGAGAAGWTGGGTNSVSGPVSSVTAASVINLGDMNDLVTAQSLPAV